MRTAFVEALIKEAERDERIFLLAGDLGYNVLEPFIKKFPERYINLGVAEQNMAGFAAGMALTGKIPVVYSIATFATLKTVEQIRNDICYQGLNVKVVGVGAGLTYSQFGATHHSVEDIALMRVLPGINVVCPGDPVEVRAATAAMMRDESPCYLRIGSRGEPELHKKDIEFEIGKGIVMKDGNDIAILATSNMLQNASEAVTILEKEGLKPALVSMHTIKPLDQELLKDIFKRFTHVFTVEEHSEIGGLGSSVAEFAAESKRKDFYFHRVALPDKFQKVGARRDRMRQINGLDPEGIAKTVKKQVHK